MALSYSKFTADGVGNVYPLVFPFLDKGHIKGQVDGEEVNLSVDTYYKRVTVTPIPKAGSLVVIRRRTPRDRTYSNFTGGNPFGQVNVNNSFLWQLYISQEISEGDVSDEFFTSNDLDMGGHRIFNLGEPKTNTDAVRVKDLDAAIDNLGDMAGSSISELPPVDKVAGRRWTRCSDMKSFIWYVDTDGAQWVEDKPSMGAKRDEQRIPTTVAIVSTGAYAVGDYLELTDRAGAKFNVVSGGTHNGYDIINAGNGNTAVLSMNTSETLTPSMFGSFNNGGLLDPLQIDTSAIQAMFNKYDVGFRSFDFGGLSYYLGEMTTNLEAFFVFTQQDGIIIKGMPKMYVKNLLVGNIFFNSVFEFVDCSDLHVECHAIGDVFDEMSPQPSGVIPVNLISDSVDARNVMAITRLEKGVAGFHSITSGGIKHKRLPTDPVYENVTFYTDVKSAKYGVRFVDSLFNVNGVINTNGVTRSYYITGCKNHNIDVNSVNHRHVIDVFIKAYRNDVSNINVNYNQRDSVTETPIHIEHENNEQDTSITNVTINANIESNPHLSHAEIGVSRNFGGSIQNTTTTCVTDDITLNFNGKNPTADGSVTLQFPTRPNKPSIVRTNRKLLVASASLKDGTNGFTVVTGEAMKGMSVGDNTLKPVRIKLDNVDSSDFMALVMVHSTDDSTKALPTNKVQRLYHLNGYKLSAGGGTVITPVVVSEILVGAGGGNIAFTVVDGALNVTSDTATTNASLSVSAQFIGGTFI